MREIKFRAWDKVHNRFMYLTMHPTSISWSSHEWMAQAPLMNNDSIEGFGFAVDGWQQFTGLKDKNGVEIYEGDILSNKDTDGNMVVNWCPISAGFCLDKKGWMFSHYFKEAVDANQCEVIGNIYENPELLEHKL